MSEEDPARVFADRVLAGRKYSSICPDTAYDVYVREKSQGGNHRKVEARARKRLHRLWADYLGQPQYEQARLDLSRSFQCAEDGDGTRTEEICRDLMAAHDSSRERLGILETFFSGLFAVTGAPSSLHDLACALNPMALRWMGLSRECSYRAYDINARTVDLINHYLQLEGREPLAEHRDILVRPVEHPGDVALLLKMYHCLEHRRRGAGWEVVSEIPTNWVVVSFPARNLAGRKVDIIGNYETGIRSGCRDRGWVCRRLDFETEIALLVGKE